MNENRSDPHPSTKPHIILIPLMLQTMIKETLELENKSQEFYKVLYDILKEISYEDLNALPLNYIELIETISNYLKNHQSKEIKSIDEDDVIIGLLKTLEVLLQKFSQHREYVGQKLGIVNEVLKNCLFEFPKEGTGKKTTTECLPPKCKSQASRQAAFSLLSILARDTPANLNQIISYVLPIHMYFIKINFLLVMVHGEQKE